MLQSFSTFTAVVQLLSATREVQGQEPQDIHPGLTECDKYGCFIDYYCDFGLNQSICEPCPGITEQECEDAVGMASGTDANQTLVLMSVEDCLNWCVRGQKDQPCSDSNPCEEGKFFCNFDFGDSGTCQECKSQVSECLIADDITSELGREDCLLCDTICVPLHFSETTVEGVKITSNALQGSPSQEVSGPIVDCTNLIHKEEEACTGADSSICLVNDYTRNTYYVDVVQKCAESGGLGVIFYGDFTPRTDNNQAWTGSLSFKATSIPSVSIPYDDGNRLNEEGSTSQAQVSVTSNDEFCFKRQFCSDTIPCIGTSAGMYCDYKWGGDEGWCRSCPTDEDGNPNPLGCFFNIEDVGKVQGQDAVESCAATCASSLEFGECKLCPQDITGFDFGVKSGSEKCSLCPHDDIKYPQKEFPLFGGGIQCWQVQKFFDSVEVNADAPNCVLAQMMNYICGCQGPGYGGASTKQKRAVLAWVPRVTALLSFLGSCFVIYDILKSNTERRKLFNQIVLTLSVFDLFGSCSYALTTLPIPEDDDIPIFGAHGNEGTCTAQGFFIQVGTISCFMNVSLSIYYLLSIKYGWSERKLKKHSLWFLACPIIVGLAFAFAGIPYYGNMILWCNNTASWWPDIPVGLAILVATMAMGSVSFHVYKREQVTDRWRGGGAAARTGQSSNRLSNKVFQQSFWFLMAFYLTWPPYLALQFSWASDNYFTRYGLILSAGILVPMQGFWHFFVYTRPRHFERMNTYIWRSSSVFFGRFFSSETESTKKGASNSSNSDERSNKHASVVSGGCPDTPESRNDATENPTVSADGVK